MRYHVYRRSLMGMVIRQLFPIPFQAPYDIRLCDGRLYRVIWTGEAGQIIVEARRHGSRFAFFPLKRR